jgi:hypothetical protein
MHREDSPAARRERRAPRLPRFTGVTLAIPVVLALAAASIATFLVGVTALLVAPRLRERATRTSRRTRTITLDRSAYRTREREGTDEHASAPMLTADGVRRCARQ